MLGILGGAAVIAALAITQVSANLGYDAAAESHADAVASASSEKTLLRGENSDLQAVTESAQLILDVCVAGEQLLGFNRFAAF